MWHCRGMTNEIAGLHLRSGSFPGWQGGMPSCSGAAFWDKPGRAFLVGAQIALVSVNTRCWVTWHSHSPPVTQERFLLLQTASGENAQAGFVAEMRTQGFSLLSAIAASLLHSFTRRDLAEALCKTLDAQWGKRSLSLPRGECKGPPLLWLGQLLHLLVHPTSKQHCYFLLYVKHNGCCLLQGTSSCLCKCHGLLGSHPKDW